MAKNYTLHPTIPCQAAIEKALASAGSERRVTLGLDAELGGAAGAICIGGSTPIDLGKHSRESWLALVTWLGAHGCEIHAVQEACGFGWAFHRRLAGAGAQSIVCAPEPMNGLRKTDKADARALAQRLWQRVLNGNERVLRPVQVPSVEQQRARDLGRQRRQMQRECLRMAAQGRSLMCDHSWLEVPSGWWQERNWPELRQQLEAACESWLIELLEPRVRMCRQLLEEAAKLQARHMEAVAALARARDEVLRNAGKPVVEEISAQRLPKGLGESTYATLNGEIMDWSRFHNRGQAGSFIGCCPSERSSGARQKLGQIDRKGSPLLRWVYVEAVWRLQRHNPGWRGFKNFGALLASKDRASGARKRKAVVACARLLQIDMWRLHTGRATMEGLGLIVAKARKKSARKGGSVA